MIADYKTAALGLSGIQHLWMLDEASGTSAADSQGSTTLTYGADVSGFLTTGPDGAAQVPVNNGSTNRVAINSTGFAPPATASYFWWQRQDVDATDDAMIWELANSPTFSHLSQLDYNNSTTSQAGGNANKAVAVMAYGGSGNGSYWDKGTTGTWYFYCLVIDPSLSAANQVKVYRDGVLVSTNAVANSLNGQTPATMKVGVLGRNNNGTRQLPIKAAASGLGIVNRVISTTEMTTLRAAMLTSPKSGSDSATGSETSSLSLGTVASASDSGSGSDSTSLLLAPRGHPNTDATFDAVATITQPTGANQELFPAMCLKNDGTLLRISRAGSGHLSTDGNLVASTSSDNGSSWTAVSTILDKTTDLRAGIPRLLANGKIIVALWQTDWSGATPQHTTYTMLSTDKTATAWGTPVALPNHTGGNGAACESGVVEMPNGDLLLVVYESESSTGTTGWSSVLYKSTDGGASWTFSTYIARSADSASPPQALYEEPFLLRLFNGDLVCAIRQSEQGFTSSTLHYVHLWRSTDSGANWTDEGRAFESFQSASRNAMFQTRDGALVLQTRIIAPAGGGSKQGAYIVSDDNGDTWGTLRNLEDGTAVASATSPPVYSYGDITQLANGKLAQIWVDETPLSGSTPAIRFATYTLTGTEAQDSGTGTEGISNVQIVRTPVAATDAGTGAESSSVTVFSFVPEAGSDTGSFSESSNVQATVLFTSVAVSDAGAAVDGATVVVLTTTAISTGDPSHQGQVARGYGGRIGGGNQGRVKITT